jgi:predicted pyridoxine 5'-phosphate oxidase superfamily flavin-nucleotide-binding protein
MRRNVAFAISISALILLAGCSNPGGGPSGSPSATPSATAKATTLDPCQLVTAAEASALSGASFGAGLEETTGTNGTGKRCTYGAQTTNVFFVQVATAATASDAQAAWATEEAEADAGLAAGFPAQASAVVTKTDVTGLGDRAAVGTGSATIEGQTISGGVIYLLKGPNFLAFGDLTLATAPTADALKAQAATSLDRMP